MVWLALWFPGHCAKKDTWIPIQLPICHCVLPALLSNWCRGRNPLLPISILVKTGCSQLTHKRSVSKPTELDGSLFIDINELQIRPQNIHRTEYKSRYGPRTGIPDLSSYIPTRLDPILMGLHKKGFTRLEHTRTFPCMQPDSLIPYGS